MSEQKGIDWDRVYKYRFCPETNPRWDSKINPISLQGTTLLGMDEENNLYWDGKLIEVRKKFSLNTFERLLAVIGIIAALASAIAAIHDSFFPSACL